MNREFKRVCAQIDDCLVGQWLNCWINAGKPCELLIKPSAKSPKLLGVIMTVKPNDRKTTEFIEIAQYITKAKMWDLTK